MPLRMASGAPCGAVRFGVSAASSRSMAKPFRRRRSATASCRSATAYFVVAGLAQGGSALGVVQVRLQVDLDLVDRVPAAF